MEIELEGPDRIAAASRQDNSHPHFHYCTSSVRGKAIHLRKNSNTSTRVVSGKGSMSPWRCGESGFFSSNHMHSGAKWKGTDWPMAEWSKQHPSLP